MGRLLAIALLGTLLLPAVPVGAEVRQRSYDGAEDDLTIFTSIVLQTVGETTAGVAAAARDDTDGVQAAGQQVGALVGGFSDELVAVIGARGTTPPGLQALHDDLEGFERAFQSFIGAYGTMHARTSALPARPTGTEGSNQVGLALAAVDQSIGTLLLLRSSSSALGDRGVDLDALLDGAADVEADLLQRRAALEATLATLRLPALLTIGSDRRAVGLADSVTFTGLALREGAPAAGTVVTVDFVGVARTGIAGNDGRYAIAIAVPLSTRIGDATATASATIDDARLTAGPLPVTIEALRSRLQVQPAATVVARSEGLGATGTLTVGPLQRDGRVVTILVDGQSMGAATTDAAGTFATSINISSLAGGFHDVSAVFNPGDARIASSRAPAIRIFVTYAPGDIRPHSDPTFTEFLFATTGLGIILNALIALTLVGLLVFASQVLLRGRDLGALRAWKRRLAFRRLVRFGKATERDRWRADPRHAFPPEDRLPPGALFRAFVDGVRRFRPVPSGVTHRELQRDLVSAGVKREPANQATLLYERIRYRGQRTPGDAGRLERSLLEVWSEFVDIMAPRR